MFGETFCVLRSAQGLVAPGLCGRWAEFTASAVFIQRSDKQQADDAWPAVKLITNPKASLEPIKALPAHP